MLKYYQKYIRLHIFVDQTGGKLKKYISRRAKVCRNKNSTMLGHIPKQKKKCSHKYTSTNRF